MRRGSLRPSVQRSKMTWIAWSLASALSLFLAENIWIAPWFKRFYGISSLVSVPLSGAWFLALAIGGITLTVLIVCQILLTQDHDVLLWKKLGTGIATLIVLLLSARWFYLTTGQPGTLRSHAAGKPHKVVLIWQASSSQAAGYNVYRSTTRGGNYVRINSSLVQRLSYTDDKVVTGETYYYVARSADSLGNESANSPEFTITIP
jgi:hypothetical protein